MIGIGGYKWRIEGERKRDWTKVGGAHGRRQRVAGGFAPPLDFHA